MQDSWCQQWQWCVHVPVIMIIPHKTNSNFLLLNITFKCTSGTEKVSSFRVKIRYYIHFNILLNPDIEKNIFLYFRYVDYDSFFNVRKSEGYII